jgi:O-antigen/teichoic acid export membrane protein
VYAASTGLVGIFCAAKSRRFYWTSPRQITHKFIAQASILGLTAFCFQLDVVFSRAQISYNDTGVYFAGAQLAKFTCLLVLSASLAFLPTIMENTADESQEKATLMKGIRFSFSVSLVVSLILLLLGSRLINFLFGLDFSGSTSLIPYFILGSLTWSVLLTRINLDISKNNNRVILMLVLLILFHFTLVSMSSSMETIALSWSITGTVGLVLYTLLAHYNWFYSKTTL